MEKKMKASYLIKKYFKHMNVKYEITHKHL